MHDKLTRPEHEWRSRLVTHAAALDEVLASVHRIAVVGIKPEEVGGPAYEVPAYLQRAGYDVVPVPVYYPEVTAILGVAVQRSLHTVTPPADMVLLFRRPRDIAAHLDELVWMQQGIEHHEVAEALARAGTTVVQDRCAMVEHRRTHR